MNFYEKVIGLCQQKGVSRSKMADEIGISRSTPKDWADKKSTPQFSTIKKIADYFGVSTEYLTNENYVDVQTVQDNHGIIGHAHAPVTILNDRETKMSEQETALLNIFKKLDVIKQAQLLAYAAELSKE